MPKVGITTFLSENYGTCLQAYALKYTVGKLGHEGIVISYRGKSHAEASNLQIIRGRFGALRKLLRAGNLVTPGGYREGQRVKQARHLAFEAFLRNELAFQGEDAYTFARLEQQQAAYDAVIAGCDMIWSPEYDGTLDIYFLAWCEPAKRIAYAPSFGVMEIEPKLLPVYRAGIDGFRFLSCRERAGCEIIQKLTGRDAAFVCDPTLLLSARDWMALAAATKSREKGAGHDYVLLNLFSPFGRKIRKTVRTVTQALDLPYEAINNGSALAQYTNKTGGFGPNEFIRLFADCSFAVVDGYHGLIFALIFRKPFVVLHRDQGEHWNTYETRMADLLRYLGAADRYLEPGAAVPQELLTMDYANLESKMEALISRSREYLFDSLQRTMQDRDRDHEE
jgi:polysaccharide pyruvyl transferase WcaK-like protein